MDSKFKAGDAVQVSGYSGYLWPHIEGLVGVVGRVVAYPRHPEEETTVWVLVGPDRASYPLDDSQLVAV
jgi:hypothetical protein